MIQVNKIVKHTCAKVEQLLVPENTLWSIFSTPKIQHRTE